MQTAHIFRAKRFSWLFVIGIIAGCTPDMPATTSAITAPAQDPSPHMATAFFAAYPTDVLRAAKEICAGPRNRFHQPNSGLTQCYELMGPRETANVILAFDGDIKNLPTMVSSLHTRKVTVDGAPGYAVTTCSYLHVPLKNGNIRRVVVNSKRNNRQMHRMLETVGGTVLPSPPPGAADMCLSAS